MFKTEPTISYRYNDFDDTLCALAGCYVEIAPDEWAYQVDEEEKKWFCCEEHAKRWLRQRDKK